MISNPPDCAPMVSNTETKFPSELQWRQEQKCYLKMNTTILDLPVKEISDCTHVDATLIHLCGVMILIGKGSSNRSLVYIGTI